VQTVINLFDDLSPQSDEEILTELLRRKGVRIERIDWPVYAGGQTL
jgi:hypothetical protein